MRCGECVGEYYNGISRGTLLFSMRERAMVLYIVNKGLGW